MHMPFAQLLAIARSYLCCLCHGQITLQEGVICAFTGGSSCVSRLQFIGFCFLGFNGYRRGQFVKERGMGVG